MSSRQLVMSKVQDAARAAAASVVFDRQPASAESLDRLSTALRGLDCYRQPLPESTAILVRVAFAGKV